jgi:hypothetical protein
MNKDIAFRCLQCGAINISRFDGRTCGQCGGCLKPIGEVIQLDSFKTNGYQPKSTLKSSPPNYGSSVYRQEIK